MPVSTPVQYIFVIAFLLASCPVVHAETSLETKPVIVTATRTTQTVDDSLASVQVINRQDIEQSQARDIAELLRFQAGVEVARSGGPGQQTSVFLRGTESNHTLLLIDGVKANNGTDSAAAWQNLDPAMIDHIEIVRGPMSSLYGSEAIGGVIQVFTKKTRHGTSESGSIGIGTNNTFIGSAHIGGAEGKMRGGLGLSVYATDGFQTRTTATIDRGYTNYSFNLDAGTELGGMDIDFSSWWSQGKTEYLDFFLAPVDQDFQNGVTALTLSVAPADIWSSVLKLSYNLDNIKQNQSADKTTTKRWAADWQNDFQLGNHQLLTAGGYVAKEKTDSIVFGGGFFAKDKNVRAVFLQDQLNYGAHQLLLAGRYTDDGFFGDKTTWNLAYGLDLGQATHLYASAGTGFKAPTSLDLFGFGGNPDLRAETSKNYELGIRHTYSKKNNVELSLFHNKIDNLITFFDPDNNPATFNSQNENVARTRIRGVELRYRYGYRNLSGEWSGIYQDPEDRSTGGQLARRAKKSMTLTANYRAGNYLLGGKLLLVGERPDSDFNNVKLDDYAVVDLNLTRHFGKHVSLLGRLENALDENYQTAGTFKSQGRALYLTIRIEN